MQNNEKNTNIDEKKKDFLSQLSYRKELEEIDKRELLAKKLKSGEISIEELDENTLQEMLQFFCEDIDKKKQELEDIKNYILKIRKELSNGQS